MMFFFKKKPVVVHCVTDEAGIFKFAPVQKASKFLPDWWKKLPKEVEAPSNDCPQPTMKRCIGMLNMYKTGFIIPMWTDLSLTVGQEGSDWCRYRFADEKSNCSFHNPVQHGYFFDPLKYQHIKIVCPWSFVCDEPLPFLLMEPTWSFMKHNTMRQLPGVVEFKYQTSTNMNFMIKRTAEDQRILIKFLEPMAHLIPITDRPIDFRLSYDPEFCDRIHHINHRCSFRNGYSIRRKTREENE